MGTGIVGDAARSGRVCAVCLRVQAVWAIDILSHPVDSWRIRHLRSCDGIFCGLACGAIGYGEDDRRRCVRIRTLHSFAVCVHVHIRSGVVFQPNCHCGVGHYGDDRMCNGGVGTGCMVVFGVYVLFRFLFNVSSVGRIGGCRFRRASDQAGLYVGRIQ